MVGVRAVVDHAIGGIALVALSTLCETCPAWCEASRDRQLPRFGPDLAQAVR